MGSHRFISPICHNGVITGEALNAQSVGIWADKVDMQIASISENLGKLVDVVQHMNDTTKELALALQISKEVNLDLLNRVLTLEAEIAELRGGSHEAVTDK